MYQAGLILEGGGMKGVYTSGVLDLLLDKGIQFSEIYGVSAGACNMCSFISGQRERAFDVFVDYLDTGSYCGIKSMLLTGDIFNVDTCYHLIPKYLNPIDVEAFRSYPGKGYCVVTNIATGRPEYFPIEDPIEDMEKVRASASMPLVSRTVMINGKPYLDGGIADAIPLRHSIVRGNRKNLVIMTKEVGYRRKIIDSSQLALIKARYLKYPKVAELMMERHIHYNECLDYIDRMEQKGQAFVLRPLYGSKVGRIEKDQKKLRLLYEQGYREAEEAFPRLLAYLES